LLIRKINPNKLIYINMKKLIPAILALVLLFLFVSCGKKSGDDQTSQKEDTKKEETRQKQEDQKIAKEDSLRQVEENANKEKLIKWAIDEEKILNDTNGQWASGSEASSTYSSDKKNRESGWHEFQMTGKPNTENYSDDSRAWASADADKGLEWVKLSYEKPVYASEIRIRQNYNPGAIIKIELIDENGKSHTVWEGPDKTKYELDKIQWMIAKFDKTTYKTSTIKITLACNAVPGWNEIDAVQLIGTK